MIKLRKTSQPGSFPIVYQTAPEHARTCWAAEVIANADGTWQMYTNNTMKVCSSEQAMRQYAERWGWTF